MLEYLRQKSTILSFIADLIVLSGIVILHWNAERGIAFFCLDIEIMIFFFFVFMRLKKEHNDYFSFIFGFFVFSAVVYGYFLTIIDMETMMTGRTTNISWKDFDKLLSPYYDVGIFIFLSGWNYAYLTMELNRIKNVNSSELFEIKSVLYRMLMIPVLFYIGGQISILCNTNIFTTPFVLFIIGKQVLDYWKFKALKRLKGKADSLQEV